MRTVAVLFLATLFACSGGDKDKQAPEVPDVTRLMGAAPALTDAAPGKTFIWGRGADASLLDPAQITDGESVKVVTNIFDTLVTFKPGGTEIVPWLATEWEKSADNLVWTFTLRDDVTFHDGTPFNAEAVVFTFERQLVEGHPARNDGDTFPYAHDRFKAVQKVEALEDGRVRFTLKEPYAPFLSALALFSTSIVPPSAFTADKKRSFASAPVGTGPFVFESWDRDSRIVLRANPDYWGGVPQVERVIFRPIQNAQARLQELRSGGIHGMDSPDLNDLAAIHADRRLRLLGRPGINLCYLAMHTLKKPFDDHRVRQAVAYAIDKEGLIEAGYNGCAEPAPSMCPVSMRGHHPMHDRRRDLDKAKRLLKEAGYPDGFKTTLWYGHNQRPYFPKPDQIALHLREDLKGAGIDAELKKLDWTAYLEATKRGEHDMCILGWMADIYDPDDFLYVLLDKENAVVGQANNVSFYQGDRAHNLMLEAQRTFDWNLRVKKYAEVQEIVFNEVPAVPLVTAPDLRVLRSEVRGYILYPAGGEYFRHVGFAP